MEMIGSVGVVGISKDALWRYNCVADVGADMHVNGNLMTIVGDEIKPSHC